MWYAVEQSLVVVGERNVDGEGADEFFNLNIVMDIVVKMEYHS